MNKLPNKRISFLEIEEGKMYKWTHFDGIVEYVFIIKKIDTHGSIDLLVLAKEGTRTIPAWGSFDWRFQEVE